MSEQKPMSEQANEQKPITVSDIIEEVTKEFCDGYCHWPYVYGDDDADRMIDEKCENCPLNRLA